MSIANIWFNIKVMKNELFLSFVKKLDISPEYYVESSGRFEVIGNHTDHNGGLCVAASCDLKIKGYLAKNDNNKVFLYSEGYDDVEISLDDLSIRKNEVGSSAGLVKGVAKFYIDHGYSIGGFYLITESTIFPGAGVSSSAAFESMIAQIFNQVYNNGKVSPIEMAKAGQYSENNYFDKKSGLLDQSAVCFGNVSFMDFSSLSVPVVKTINFPFDDMRFVIVNTGGSHADLSDLYSAIPTDMKAVAAKLGKQTLSETSLEEVEKIKDELSEIEYKRAKHFFNENQRVLTLVKALENKDKATFLKMIKESFESSRDLLENMMVKGHYEGSPLEACDYAYEFLKDKGACKINGGGFAGSIIACMSKTDSYPFLHHMMAKYPRENIAFIEVNPNPPIVEKL